MFSSQHLTAPDKWSIKFNGILSWFLVLLLEQMPEKTTSGRGDSFVSWFQSAFRYAGKVMALALTEWCRQ